MTYTTGAAFRQALEDRLLAQSSRDRVSLVWLRKLVAFDRFLARLLQAQPDAWILKGGLALQLGACAARRGERSLVTSRATMAMKPRQHAVLRCELDAAYFHLYGIARDDVDYILETFPIVKRKDLASHGEYRTKRVILEIYDAMQQAMESGQPYQTRLDPPPADPRVAHDGPPPEWVALPKRADAP